MTSTASKIYDHAADTVHDWVDTVRDELPDVKDIQKALPDMKDVKGAAADITDRAGDLWGDASEHVMALLPGAAARAARARRRRWVLGGLAVVGLALLFGPGGAERRAAIKARITGWFGEANPTDAPMPASSGSGGDVDVPDQKAG